MQKLLFSAICFFFPVFLLPNLEPIITLLKIGIIYELKIALTFFAFSLIACIWSIVAFFKFLFGGFQFKHLMEFILSVAFCWFAFSYSKYLVKNLHQRPVKILRSKLSYLADFQNLKHDYVQAKNNLLFCRRNFIYLKNKYLFKVEGVKNLSFILNV